MGRVWREEGGGDHLFLLSSRLLSGGSGEEGRKGIKGRGLNTSRRQSCP